MKYKRSTNIQIDHEDVVVNVYDKKNKKAELHWYDNKKLHFKVPMIWGWILIQSFKKSFLS